MHDCLVALSDKWGVAVGAVVLRITSYNVCYTKLSSATGNPSDSAFARTSKGDPVKIPEPGRGG